MPSQSNLPGNDLGLGDLLPGQVQNETEEQRRRRLLGLDLSRPVSSMLGGSGLGPVSKALTGGLLGGGR